MLVYRGLRSTLTWVRVSRFDLDGRAAPVVLLYLGHPLSSHLVGVVSGAHGDLVLDDTLDLQLVAAAAANRRRIEPLKLQSSDSECMQRAVALWGELARSVATGCFVTGQIQPCRLPHVAKPNILIQNIQKGLHVIQRSRCKTVRVSILGWPNALVCPGKIDPGVYMIISWIVKKLEAYLTYLKYTEFIMHLWVNFFEFRLFWNSKYGPTIYPADELLWCKVMS